jgi:hypothetical protein
VIRLCAAALAASALAACAVLPEGEGPPPLPCNVTVDGSLNVSEWQSAQRIELANGAALWLKQTTSHVCFAVEQGAAAPRYVDVFIADRAGTLHNLHASMQVGERTLPARRWTDEEPPTAWGQTTGWTANAATQLDPETHGPSIEQVAPFDGYEFVIDRAQLSPWRIRVEVRDFHGEARDIVWPAQSRRTDIATWAVLPQAP